jgi:hypothetical protein
VSTARPSSLAASTSVTLSLSMREASRCARRPDLPRITGAARCRVDGSEWMRIAPLLPCPVQAAPALSTGGAQRTPMRICDRPGHVPEPALRHPRTRCARPTKQQDRVYGSAAHRSSRTVTPSGLAGVGSCR